MKNKATIQTGTIIAGVLTAVVIVVSQLFYFEKAHIVKKEIKTEQSSSDDAGDEAYITLPSSTLPSSSTHVEFNQEAFFLFEIVFEEKEQTEPYFNIKLPLSTFFRTLFGAIISPNAP